MEREPINLIKTLVAFFITILIPVIISGILAGSYFMIGLMLLCIPYGIVGLITWAIVRCKNRSIALGILLGGIAPFVIVFIATNGCQF